MNRLRCWTGTRMVYGIGLREDGTPFKAETSEYYELESDKDFKGGVVMEGFALNGKIVYENDIVKKTNMDIDIIVFGNIGYDGSRNGLAGFEFNEHYREDGDFFELQYYNDINELVVIGNTYENPELLQPPLSDV
jgi:YopX protein